MVPIIIILGFKAIDGLMVVGGIDPLKPTWVNLDTSDGSLIEGTLDIYHKGMNI